MDNKDSVSSGISLRSSNFELLRILSMLMIVASHYAYFGVMHIGESDASLWLSGSLAHKLFSCFLQMGELGVALFFMISGYFLIEKSKVSVFKIAFKTVFYSVFLGIILAVPYIKFMGGGTLV